MAALIKATTKVLKVLPKPIRKIITAKKKFVSDTENSSNVQYSRKEYFYRDLDKSRNTWRKEIFNSHII